MKSIQILSLSIALALTACGGSKEKETGGTAGGEILPGSISDAMLPHDTVQSQAPLAPSAKQSAASGDEKDEAKGGETDAEAAPAAAPSESAEPAPAEAE